MGTNRIIILRTRSIRVSQRDAEKAADLRERNRLSVNRRCKVRTGSTGSQDEFHPTELCTAWTHQFDRVGTELDRLRSLDRRGSVFYWGKVAASGCCGAQGLSRLPDKIGRQPTQEVPETYSRTSRLAAASIPFAFPYRCSASAPVEPYTWEHFPHHEKKLVEQDSPDSQHEGTLTTAPSCC